MFGGRCSDASRLVKAFSTFESEEPGAMFASTWMTVLRFVRVMNGGVGVSVKDAMSPRCTMFPLLARIGIAERFSRLV